MENGPGWKMYLVPLENATNQLVLLGKPVAASANWGRWQDLQELQKEVLEGQMGLGLDLVVTPWMIILLNFTLSD